MVSLIDALAARENYAFEVVYCCESAPERSWGAPTGKLPHRILKGVGLQNGFRFNPGLLSALNGIRADVWVLNSVYTSASTLLAAWWLKRQGIPMAFMNEPVRKRGRLIALLKTIPLRFVLKRAGAILTTGRKAASMYGELCPEGTVIDCVPYYLDLSRFLELPLPEITGGCIEFICCCQLIPRKGLDVLLQACERLPAKGWRLTIAGEGELFQSLQSDFAERWPEDQVRFIGPLHFNDRFAAFGGKHVFVLPSRWDGWGMVVPEALAAGLPVISTDRVISAHEFILNGRNGFVIPSDDPGTLADRMLWFLQNSSSIPQMGRAARSALKDYRPEIGAERLVRRASALAYSGDLVPRPLLKQSNDGPLTWKNLNRPSSAPERVLSSGRRWARSCAINASLALKMGREMTGNRILAGHIVLPEDKSRFREQIRFLSDHFEFCPISSLAELARRETNASDHALAITFDDGFRILMGDCLEVLEEFGIKASFFVPTGFIELSGEPRQSALFSFRVHPYLKIPLEPMRPEDLKTLVALGHEVGSHGISHTSIRAMAEPMALHEMTYSRRRIQEWTGRAPNSFAFPYGDTASSVLDPAACLRSAGYEFGLTLRRGKVERTSNPLLLPRDHFEGNWPVRHLRYFLSSH
jgi:glycosyltransferase involved in cell wall biosynthesis/peptidoglycan/xylan/chitin deacetylase (PgdA/CDA1 family)